VILLFWDCDTSRGSRRDVLGRSLFLRGALSGPVVSRDLKVRSPADVRDRTASQLLVKVQKIIAQLYFRRSLRPVVGIRFEVPQPHLPVLPKDIFLCFHARPRVS